MPKFRRTTSAQVTSRLREAVEKAETQQEREQYELALELAEAGALPPWIRRTGSK